MTQEQIKQTADALANLTPEQKESFKQQFMAELAKIDNLGEISNESLEKITGGDILGDIRRFLGYWVEQLS